MKIKKSFMRKFILLFSLFSHLALLSQSTNEITISGKIIDKSIQKPLAYASIIFEDLDSINTKYGGITNDRGNFSFHLPKGNYKVTVSFISFKSTELTKTSFSKSYSLGTIELESDIENLNEINIVARKKPIEYKANKLIANIGKDISGAGGMATDVLNNIPSVSIDLDGNILLRGQQNVTVMINGRVSSFSKAEALKSLPANSIDKIEVISNPGASYSASYSSIINIILKKGKDQGFNASITSTIGQKVELDDLPTTTTVSMLDESFRDNRSSTTSIQHRRRLLSIDIDR